MELHPATIPACGTDDGNGGTHSVNCWSTWNVGEAITVDTNCDGTCTITINVLNNREGITLDTTVIDVE